MMEEKDTRFFDIHCHAFGLNHAGLLAFLNRFFKNNALTFSDIVNLRIFKIIRSFYRPSKGIVFLGMLIILATAVELGWGLIFFRADQFPIPLFLFWGLVGISLLIGNILLAALLGLLALSTIRRKNLRQRISNTINLFSLIENDLGRQLLYVELDILKQDPSPSVQELIRAVTKNPNSLENLENVAREWEKLPQRSFQIGPEKFEKVIVTPLMMDFNCKGFEKIEKKDLENIHYRLAPRKPIVEQRLDLIYGILDYRFLSPFKILEIFPFMGLNTKNYDLGLALKVERCPNLEGFLAPNDFFYLEKFRWLAIPNPPGPENKALWNILEESAADDKERSRVNNIRDQGKDAPPFSGNTLVKMLAKLFRTYGHDYQRLREAFETNFPKGRNLQVKQSIMGVDVERGFFAGIKVYPPLSFDPWPELEKDDVTREDLENKEEERRKVEFLYAFCSEKDIPITTHCSDSGFMVEERDKARAFTCPAKWEKVLSQYQRLRLNFAHFGRQPHGDSEEWKRMIIALMRNHQNVYADFSYSGVNSKFYDELAQTLLEHPEIKNRVLFGTDFLINLIDIQSYEDYLKYFFETGAFTDSDKRLFCVTNPNRFLFG